MYYSSVINHIYETINLQVHSSILIINLFIIKIHLFVSIKTDEIKWHIKFRDQFGGCFGLSVTHFSARKVPKNGIFFWENWFKWPIFGAAGAENFEKFRWKIIQFSERWRFHCMIIHKMKKNVGKHSV